MVLMTEKRISGETCHAIHQYAKANNKYMNTMINTKNHQILTLRQR